MKNSILIAGMVLLAASCSSESDVTSDIQESSNALVSVHVDNFTIEQEEFAPAGGMTRTSSALADYDGVKAITLAFYSGTEEVYKATQLLADASTYTTFGEFSIPLSVGSYTMVVLGYGSTSEITLTNPTSAAYTSDKGRETFVAVQTVNVTSTADLNITATLSRVVTRLRVESTDNMPRNVAKVNISVSVGGLSFNPTTGFATVNTGFTNEITASSGFGRTAFFNTYFFLASDEQTVNVTINVLDAGDNVLFSKALTGVPMKRNRCTVLSGKLFSTDATASGFTIDADWIDNYNIDF